MSSRNLGIKKNHAATTAEVTRESKKAPECVVCSQSLIGDSHQLVFDEVGTELNLQRLLWQCFNLQIVQSSASEQTKVQAVCANCLDELIETYDMQEKEVEEKAIDGGEGPSGSREEPQQSGSRLDNEDSFDGNDFEEEEELNEMMANEEKYNAELLHGEWNRELDDGMENSEVDDETKESYTVKEEIPDSSRQEAEDVEVYENVDFLYECDQNFDWRTYKAEVSVSRYDDIVFPENMDCCHCSEEFGKHIDLIKHTIEVHCIEDFAYPCAIDRNCEPLKSLDDLTYHLVFSHYDLKKISIYTQCQVCSKRFTNFPAFNKHSCYHDKVSLTTTECAECGEFFQSNKRYRFHLQFHLKDHRPMGCLLCDKMFGDVNVFYEHVNYGHDTDTGLICTRCDRIFTSDKNLENHQKVHGLWRPYKCQLCSKSYLYSQLLKDHVIGHHTKNKTFQCPICDKYLFKQTLLNKHIMLHQKPEEKTVYCCSECGLVGDSEEDTELHIRTEHDDGTTEICMELIDIEIAYCCEYCELAFRSPEMLQQHRELHVKKEFHCNMCPLVYAEYKNLKTHKITHVDYVDKRKTFPVMRHYMCDVVDCINSYMHWTTLRSHKRNKHSSKDTISCSQCSEEFKDPIRYNQHMQIAHGGAVHSCPFCDKTYSSKMAISVHIARKHNSVKIHCDECTSVFTNDAYLKRHKASVHCRLKCNECDKVLKNLKNLQVHQRMVHEKEKRYFCQYCNKGYYNQCDCIEHEETVHKKLKRYQCDKCDYKAIYKQTLTIHMRAHNNETPYKCTLCPKAFRRAYALSLHLRRHYNIRDFVCPYEGCGSAYPNQGILNSHLRKKHPNGINVKGRKRKTIAIVQNLDGQSEDDEHKDMSEGAKEKEPSAKRNRRKFDAPVSNVFFDDDDGLDDGVIGEPHIVQQQMYFDDETREEEEDCDNPEENPVDSGQQVAYIIGDIIETPAVIVQRNESDHDYIVRGDDNRIYGNVIEEYEVITDEMAI